MRPPGMRPLRESCDRNPWRERTQSAGFAKAMGRGTVAASCVSSRSRVLLGHLRPPARPLTLPCIAPRHLLVLNGEKEPFLTSKLSLSRHLMRTRAALWKGCRNASLRPSRRNIRGFFSEPRAFCFARHMSKRGSRNISRSLLRRTPKICGASIPCVADRCEGC